MGLSSSLLLIVLVIAIYAILIEIFSVLFQITGMNRSKSVFQTISLLTSTGFTTSESELVMNSKARRHIATVAMLTSYAFSVIIVSLLINIFLSLKVSQIQESIWYFVGGIGGLIVLLIVLKIPYVKKSIDKSIEKIAVGIIERKNHDNVITILDNYGNDAIVDIYLNRIPEILYGRTLYESQIKNRYKMNFLSVTRKGKSHEVTKDTMFSKGDYIVIYGNYQNIKDLFLDHSGNTHKELTNQNDNRQNEFELIENYGHDAMFKLHIKTVPKILIDKTLFDSELKREHKINVMTLKRNDEVIQVNKETRIEKNDILIVFGPFDSIKRVFYLSNEDLKELNK
ncbi:MAG: TrkA C-terminal domain-containing protein [Clostridia bacterium]|nr:TrkA C-terminal domain-containing protein [Clostridia bacterium]